METIKQVVHSFDKLDIIKSFWHRLLLDEIHTEVKGTQNTLIQRLKSLLEAQKRRLKFNPYLTTQETLDEFAELEKECDQVPNPLWRFQHLNSNGNPLFNFSKIESKCLI